MASEPTPTRPAREHMRDELEDVIQREFCKPWNRGVAGDYEPLTMVEVLDDPRRMRWLSALQTAAWEVVERFVEFEEGTADA